VYGYDYFPILTNCARAYPFGTRDEVEALKTGLMKDLYLKRKNEIEEEKFLFIQLTLIDFLQNWIDTAI